MPVRLNETSMKMPLTLRDDIKVLAQYEAKKLDIPKISMLGYLSRMVAREKEKMEKETKQAL